MNDHQLLRYSRHILLDELGVEGQQSILNGRVLIIGAGGLGCPAALYLGSAGVGEITVVDHDTVDITNLQRQIAHTMAYVGQPKVESLRAAITAINPEVRVQAIAQRAEGLLLDELTAQAHLVLDCSDNFKTRQAVNASCVQHRKPLVSAAAIRFDAQLAVYDLRQPASPCYACVFDPRESFEETLCSTMGVFAPLVGLVGALQAGEALKLLSGAGQSMHARLLMVEGRQMTFHEVRLARNPDCPVCGAAQH